MGMLLQCGDTLLSGSALLETAGEWMCFADQPQRKRTFTGW